MWAHVGAVRFAYNWCLDRTQTHWAEQKELAEEHRSYRSTSAYTLRRELNAVKEEIAPWWKDVSKEAFSTGCANAASAYTNFFSKRGKHPRFRSRKQAPPAIQFSTGTRRLADHRHIVLPRLGSIRLHENATKLARALRRGGRITTCIVKHSRTRWHVSVRVEVESTPRSSREADRGSVGVDLGIKTFAVTSDGDEHVRPKHYEAGLRRQARAQRSLARKQGGSRRHERQRQRLARLAARTANREEDFIQKFTTALLRQNSTVCIEDLNVAGMVKNRRLSRRIAHAGFGLTRTLLQNKADRFDAQIVVVDRFYPSSKTCSSCSAVRTKLSLEERVFRCHECNLEIDRDLNAALNIRDEGLRIVAQSCGETLNGRGEEGSTAGSPAATILDEASRSPRRPTPRRGHPVDEIIPILPSG